MKAALIRFCMLVLAAPALADHDFNLRVQTDLGSFDMLMLRHDAPLTVDHFMTNYVDTGLYENSFFHRSIPDFVVQGGGFVFDGVPGTFFTGGAVDIPEINVNFEDTGRLNTRGSVALAQLNNDPDSGNSQWFVNLDDNSFLDPVFNPVTMRLEGFVVFAEVSARGLAIFDDISTLPVCGDTSVDCGITFPDLPMAAVIQDNSNQIIFDDDILINLNYIGLDEDLDGVVDKLEDQSPDAGNGAGNGADNVPDSTQQDAMSFPNDNGDYLFVRSANATFSDTDILGETFMLTTAPSLCLRDATLFENGFVGSTLTPTAGGTATVEVTLPAGVVPDTWYAYGPTQDNPIPHWFEFLYDGQTGAELNGTGTVTLHFADGLRGDTDQDTGNGTIRAAPGGPGVVNASPPAENDRVTDAEEDAAPNNGDGNNDGTDDRLQDHVASFDVRPAPFTTTFVTLVGGNLTPVRVRDQGLVVGGGGRNDLPLPPGTLFNGLNFPVGFMEFEACGGGDVVVDMILPVDIRPDTYFMYGPTPDNKTPHYYEFLFDGTTGAEFIQEADRFVVRLHFRDGERGDADLDSANGIVMDPGGPALRVPVTGSGDGGGCSLRSTQGNAWQGGLWWLLMSYLLLATSWRRRERARRRGA